MPYGTDNQSHSGPKSLMQKQQKQQKTDSITCESKVVLYIGNPDVHYVKRKHAQLSGDEYA